METTKIINDIQTARLINGHHKPGCKQCDLSVNYVCEGCAVDGTLNDCIRVIKQQSVEIYKLKKQLAMACNLLSTGLPYIAEAYEILEIYDATDHVND